jgi:hypothetical protein
MCIRCSISNAPALTSLYRLTALLPVPRLSVAKLQLRINQSSSYHHVHSKSKANRWQEGSVSSSSSQLPILTTTACDLCFNKKIRCDLREPKCSNCISYGADCRHDITRHRAHLARPSRQNAPSQTDNSAATSSQSSDVSTPELLEPPPPAPSASVAAAAPGPQRWRFDSVKPTLYYGPPDAKLQLPPVEVSISS